MTLIDDLTNACYQRRIDDVKRLLRDHNVDVNARNSVCCVTIVSGVCDGNDSYGDNVTCVTNDNGCWNEQICCVFHNPCSYDACGVSLCFTERYHVFISQYNTPHAPIVVLEWLDFSYMCCYEWSH